MLKIMASDSLDDFTIEYINGETKKFMLLNLQQNGWQLSSLDAKPKWIANPTIDWPEALKRSLIIVT